jgi:hypothetical protein
MTIKDWKGVSQGLLKKYARNFSVRETIIINDFIEVASEAPDEVIDSFNNFTTPVVEYTGEYQVPKRSDLK